MVAVCYYKSMNERIEKLKEQSKKDLYIALGTVITTGSGWYGLHSLSKDISGQVSETGAFSEDMASEAVWMILGKFEPFFIVLFIVSVIYFLSQFRQYRKDRRV